MGGLIVTQKWWAVLDPLGHVSDLKHLRGIAEATMMLRDDRERCRIAPATVTVDLTPPPKQQSLPPPKKARGKR
jgi:hypothetical protein